MVLLQEIVYCYPKNKEVSGETTCGIYQHNVLLKSITVPTQSLIHYCLELPISSTDRITIQMVNANKNKLRAREVILEPEQLVPDSIISDLNLSTQEELQIILSPRKFLKDQEKCINQK